MLDTLPALSLQILELTKEQGQITISRLVKFTGANRNTVKKHLQSLVSANYLTQHWTRRNTWYTRT
ncbi:MAG: DUF977 family protein [Gammaproteobacteria bacterium]